MVRNHLPQRHSCVISRRLVAAFTRKSVRRQPARYIAVDVPRHFVDARENAIAVEHSLKIFANRLVSR